MTPNGFRIACCLVPALLAACDFFSSRDSAPKPADIRPLEGLFRTGDSLIFQATESLRDPVTGASLQTLARSRLRFLCLGDSLLGGDTLKTVSLRVTDDSTGALVYEDTGLVAFGGESASVQGFADGDGARYTPLKVAAVAADSGAFQALPAYLSLGWTWKQAQGIFEVTRAIAGAGTLSYRGALQECWRVTEIVVNGSQTASSGTYWYGVSGLLRGDQDWEDFERRGSGGDSVGGAGRVRLHRELVRL